MTRSCHVRVMFVMSGFPPKTGVSLAFAGLGASGPCADPPCVFRLRRFQFLRPPDPCAARAGTVSWPRPTVATPNIFSEVHLKFIRHAYMRMMLPPSEVTAHLNAKYQTTYAVTQVQRVINNRGWSKRRKLVVEKLGTVEEKKDTAIVRELATKHAAVMDKVAEGAVAGLDRAASFVRDARDARSLNAAASALKSLTATYRCAAGIDTSNTRSGPSVYTFNFAQHNPDAPVEKPVVDISAEPTEDDE